MTWTAPCPSHNMSCQNMFPLIRCICVKFETTASNLKIAGLEDPGSRGTLHGCKWDQAENNWRARQRILVLTLLMVACFTCDHFRLVCDPRILNRSTERLSRILIKSTMGEQVSVKFWYVNLPIIVCSPCVRISLFPCRRSRPCHIYRDALLTCRRGQPLLPSESIGHSPEDASKGLFAMLCAMEIVTLAQQPRRTP